MLPFGQTALPSMAFQEAQPLTQLPPMASWVHLFQCLTNTTEASMVVMGLHIQLVLMVTSTAQML